MPDTRVICVSCGRRRTEGNYIMLDYEGHAVCRDRMACRWNCNQCGATFGTDTPHSISGSRKVCHSCAPPELYAVSDCAECGDELTGSRYMVEGRVWCRACTSSRSTTYPCCSLRFRVTSESSMGSAWCPTCITSHTWECGEHGRVRNGGTCSTCYSNSEGVIALCRCNAGQQGEAIHDARCTPTLTFNGVGPLYFGVELEIQIPSASKIRLASEMAKKRFEPKIAVLKNDSSIGGGFEVVTMPCSYDYYRNESDVLFDTVRDIARDYSGRSWNTATDTSVEGGSCGIHIHVSRDGFTDVGHQHRFVAFIYHNTEMMMKFGGRKNTYARFDDAWVMDLYEKPHISVQHKLTSRGEKYSAVNTCHDKTFELRFFRGNMKKEGILANIGLVHAMVEYTRQIPTLSESDVPSAETREAPFKVIQFEHGWDKFTNYVMAHRELYPETIERLPNLSTSLLDIANSTIDEGGAPSVS